MPRKNNQKDRAQAEQKAAEEHLREVTAPLVSVRLALGHMDEAASEIAKGCDEAERMGLTRDAVMTMTGLSKSAWAYADRVSKQNKKDTGKETSRARHAVDEKPDMPSDETSDPDPRDDSGRNGGTDIDATGGLEDDPHQDDADPAPSFLSDPGL